MTGFLADMASSTHGFLKSLPPGGAVLVILLGWYAVIGGFLLVLFKTEKCLSKRGDHMKNLKYSATLRTMYREKPEGEE